MIGTDSLGANAQWSWDHSHLWIGGFLVFLLLWRSWRCSRWPNDGDVFGIIVAGSGLYGSAHLIITAVHSKADAPGASAWMLLAAAIILALTSLRGAWAILTNYTVQPQQDPPIRSQSATVPTSTPAPVPLPAADDDS